MFQIFPEIFQIFPEMFQIFPKMFQILFKKSKNFMFFCHIKNFNLQTIFFDKSLNV
jgi:hypothetical protein